MSEGHGPENRSRENSGPRSTHLGERGPEWEYRFPTVVGVRYEGEDGRVEDADRLDVPRADSAGIPVKLEVEMVISDGAPERTLPHAPDHALQVRAEGKATHVTLATSSRLDRDVVVRWTAAAPDVGVHLIEGIGLEGDDGRYALVTVTPPENPRSTFPRDLTILIEPADP